MPNGIPHHFPKRVLNSSKEPAISFLRQNVSMFRGFLLDDFSVRAVSGSSFPIIHIKNMNRQVGIGTERLTYVVSSIETAIFEEADVIGVPAKLCGA